MKAGGAGAGPGGRRGRRSVAAGIAFLAAASLVVGGCAGGESDAPAGGGQPDDAASVRSGTPERFGFGTPISEEDVDAWDIDVGPHGEGLPPGAGSVREGAAVYQRSCARCHGPQGEGGMYMPLVGPEPRDSFPFARRPELVSTIGNYWPYATTVFDYVRRSMPFDDPGSLSDEEVYAVTAWLLWRNDLVARDAVMTAETLPEVEMRAKEHFVPSDDVSLDSMP